MSGGSPICGRDSYQSSSNCVVIKAWHIQVHPQQHKVQVHPYPKTIVCPDRLCRRQAIGGRSGVNHGVDDGTGKGRKLERRTTILAFYPSLSASVRGTETALNAGRPQALSVVKGGGLGCLAPTRKRRQEPAGRIRKQFAWLLDAIGS